MSAKPHPFESRRRARRRVLQALYQWHITGYPVKTIIAQFLDEQDWAGADQDYFKQLLTEVIENFKQFDNSLQAFLDRPLEQVDLTELAILRLAAAELIMHPEVPYRVVLDEAVNLAKRFGAEQGHSFVNGVLDPAVRKWRASEIESSSG